VLIGGQDVTHWPMPRRVRRGLARSFQITCIVPGFTALENTALAGAGAQRIVVPPV